MRDVCNMIHRLLAAFSVEVGMKEKYQVSSCRFEVVENYGAGKKAKRITAFYEQKAAQSFSNRVQMCYLVLHLYDIR